MEQSVGNSLLELGLWAIPASLLINGIINVVGFIPSLVVTTANVLEWGPWLGGALSWLGEVIGSVAAFLFYRKGIKLAKIPSIALEVGIGYGFIHIKQHYIQIVLLVLSIGIEYWVLKKRR